MKRRDGLVALLLILLACGCTLANEFKSRQLQSAASAQTMRIWIDYADSDNQWKNDALKSKYFFSKEIMEKTKQYYAATLMVRNRKDSYTWPDTDVSATKRVTGRTVSYDLWTYFYVYNKDSTNFAAASPSAFDDTTGRPIVGYFELNLFAINSVNSLGAIQYLGTFVHEFYHILVFNSFLYDKFRDDSNQLIPKSNLIGSVTLGGKTRQTYKGPNVVNWAKTYLNFNGLTQIVMENDGGSGSEGSHWEHRYWMTDFMCPIDTRPTLLTALSLKMAVDSGWFTLNMNYVEEMEYGKNQGIDIQTDSCPTSAIRGYCTTPEERSCSPDWMYKARCYTDTTYSENCYFKWGDVFCTVPNGDYGDYLDKTYDNLGDTSRCVMSTVTGGSALPRCAKTSCSGTTSVTYTFTGSKTCTCTSASSTPTCSDAAISVTCPSAGNIADLCTRLQDANRCPGDCSGKGICLGANGAKICYCNYGWKGNDCNTANSDETSTTITNTPEDTTAKLRFAQLIAGAGLIVMSTFSVLN